MNVGRFGSIRDYKTNFTSILKNVRFRGANGTLRMAMLRRFLTETIGHKETFADGY